MAAYNFQNDRGIGNEPFDLESLLALIKLKQARGGGGLSTLRPEAAPPQSITPTDPDAPEPIRPRGYVEPYDVASTIGREPEATEPGLSGFQKFQGVASWLAPHLASVAEVLGKPEAARAIGRQKAGERQAGLDALYQQEIERRGALQESQARSQSAERARQAERQRGADVRAEAGERRAVAGFETPEEKASRAATSAQTERDRLTAATAGLGLDPRQQFAATEGRGIPASAKDKIDTYARASSDNAKISSYATQLLGAVGWTSGDVTSEQVNKAVAMLNRAVSDKQGMTDEFVRANMSKIMKLIRSLDPNARGDAFDIFFGGE